MAGVAWRFVESPPPPARNTPKDAAVDEAVVGLGAADRLLVDILGILVKWNEDSSGREVG
jgi:hypothetical protein